MYLRQCLAKILSEDPSETQLINALRALIAEYDCDHDFYSGPTLDIPPAAYVRELELNLTYEQ